LNIFQRRAHTDERLASAFYSTLKAADAKVFEAYRNDIVYWQWEACDHFQVLQDAQAEHHVISTELILSRCRESGCVDAHDKVYGISSVLNPAIAAQILPDYESPFRDTYVAFAKSWIETEDTLEVLIQCGEEKNKVMRNDLPSWVPDLRTTRRTMTSPFEQKYSANGGNKSSVHFISDTTVMLAKGVVLDTLDGLSGTRYWEDDLDKLDDILHSQHYANAYGDDVAFKDALCRTLLGNRDRLGAPPTEYDQCVLDSAILDSRFSPPIPTPQTGDTNESWLWNLHLFMVRNSSFVLGGRPLQDYFQDFHALEEDADRYFNSIGRMLEFLWSRKLVTTEKGYLGVAFQDARRGDVVAIFLGCSYPILLRPCGKTYKVVSHCYIHGFMEGEIVELLRTGEYRLQDIAVS
jgi:hypothetical protein